jgi:hypothetical protein
MTFWCQKLAVWIVLDSSAAVMTVNTCQFGVSSHAAINSWQLETVGEVILHWIEDWRGKPYRKNGANKATNKRNADCTRPLCTDGTIVDPSVCWNGRGHKSRQDKLHTDWAKVDTNWEKKRADIKAFNEMMEGREAERKAYMTICTTKFNIQDSAFAHRLYLCVSYHSWNKQQ